MRFLHVDKHVNGIALIDIEMCLGLGKSCRKLQFPITERTWLDDANKDPTDDEGHIREYREFLSAMRIPHALRNIRQNHEPNTLLDDGDARP